VAENEKTGIWTNGQQDEKIFELYQQMALQNQKLGITNESLEKLSNDLKDVCICLRDQDKRIQKLEKEVTRHSVWIGLITLGVGALITRFINELWALSK
jgi:hypothetical protein